MKKIYLIIISLLVLLVLCTSVFAIKTFTVEESEDISIAPEAEDPDGDEVVFSYSSPFDELGNWETNLDDAGEYLVDITASDGELETTETIKIVVENKNQNPIFTKTSITVEEGDLVDINMFIVDPDGDILEYNIEEPFDSFGKWQTGLDDAGRYVIDLIVNDGQSNTNERFEIIVENVNQAPSIVSVFSDDSIVNAQEDDDFEFSVSARDEDGDSFGISWLFDGRLVGTSNSGETYLDFESEGEHILTLVLSDGVLEERREWTIVVANKNRKPELDDFDVTVFESETVSLDLPLFDLDGDSLTYTFENPLNELGEWQTSYEDAGKYSIRAEASDGEFSERFDIDIEVLDVDRAPEFVLEESFIVNEGEEFELSLDAIDLDGDDVTYEFVSVPEGAFYDDRNEELSWDVSYDYITRKDNFFYNFLNAIRVEHLFISKKKVPVEIKACGESLCTSAMTNLIVHNINRAPVLTESFDQVINETDYIRLFADAFDPDGDVIRYTFTDPLGKWSAKWQTDYDDAGEYQILVTASDGRLKDSKNITLIVNDVNREPTLKIKEDFIKINEGEQFTIQIDAQDPDGDAVHVSLANAPTDIVLTNNSFIWTPNYDTVASTGLGLRDRIVSYNSWANRKFSHVSTLMWLEFTVSDGEYSSVHPVGVQIKNRNRAPVIASYDPEEVIKVDAFSDPVVFALDVYDLDQQALEYTWTFGGLDLSKEEGSESLSRVFTSPGKKKVEVEISDGRNSVEHQWTVLVEGESRKIVSAPKPAPKPNTAPVEDPYTWGFYRIDDWK